MRTRRFYTVDEFARLANVKPGTVRRRCERGHYATRPHEPGGHWKILSAELSLELKRQRRP